MMYKPQLEQYFAKKTSWMWDENIVATKLQTSAQTSNDILPVSLKAPEKKPGNAGSHTLAQKIKHSFWLVTAKIIYFAYWKPFRKFLLPGD